MGGFKNGDGFRKKLWNWHDTGKTLTILTRHWHDTGANWRGQKQMKSDFSVENFGKNLWSLPVLKKDRGCLQDLMRGTCRLNPVFHIILTF